VCLRNAYETETRLWWKGHHAIKPQDHLGLHLVVPLLIKLTFASLRGLLAVYEGTLNSTRNYMRALAIDTYNAVPLKSEKLKSKEMTRGKVFGRMFRSSFAVLINGEKKFSLQFIQGDFILKSVKGGGIFHGLTQCHENTSLNVSSEHVPNNANIFLIRCVMGGIMLIKENLTG
jgi:hypothetical protein